MSLRRLFFQLGKFRFTAPSQELRRFARRDDEEEEEEEREQGHQNPRNEGSSSQSTSSQREDKNVLTLGVASVGLGSLLAPLALSTADVEKNRELVMKDLQGSISTSGEVLSEHVWNLVKDPAIREAFMSNPEFVKLLESLLCVSLEGTALEGIPLKALIENEALVSQLAERRLLMDGRASQQIGEVNEDHIEETINVCSKCAQSIYPHEKSHEPHKEFSQGSVGQVPKTLVKSRVLSFVITAVCAALLGTILVNFGLRFKQFAEGLQLIHWGKRICTAGFQFILLSKPKSS